MPQLTDKEIAERVRKKYAEFKARQEEIDELRDEFTFREYLDNKNRVNTKMFVLEEILGIE